MRKSVLIVDDNHICIEGIRTAIPWKELDIDSIFEMYDGQSALEHIRHHHVDLIISDISMPGFSGLELSEAVMALDPAIKIILISAYDEFEYAKSAVRLGAFDYVEKPVNYDYLLGCLKKALSEIEQEKRNLEILKNSRPAMEEKFFRTLIRTAFQESPNTLDLYADYLGLDLSCSCCSVLYISIKDSALLKQKLGIEVYHARFMNLENYIRNICTDYPVHYILNDLTGFICILGDKSISKAEFKRKLLADFTSVSKYFHGRFEPVISLGSIISNIRDLPSSYQQAKKALEYRFFFPEQNILEVANIVGNDNALLLEKEADDEELIQLICKNDLAAIRTWIQKFTDFFLNNYISKNLVYSRLYSILSRILRLMFEMNITDKNWNQEINSVFINPDRFSSIQDISGWLLDFCENICDRLQKSVSNYHQSLCKAAASYIEKNYSSNTLNLNEIAEYVQIAPTYLSTLFKKWQGQNINNYITDVRINASCQLLKNTTLSLKVISDRVGYSNQYYFSACFKKKMGVTPSVYREDPAAQA